MLGLRLIHVSKMGPWTVICVDAEPLSIFKHKIAQQNDKCFLQLRKWDAKKTHFGSLQCAVLVWRNLWSFKWRPQLSYLQSGSLLQTRTGGTSIVIRAWISNYIYTKRWNVTTHPSPNFNGGLVHFLPMLGHGWVIAAHRY